MRARRCRDVNPGEPRCADGAPGTPLAGNTYWNSLSGGWTVRVAARQRQKWCGQPRDRPHFFHRASRLHVAPTLCNSMGMAGSIVERWNA